MHAWIGDQSSLNNMTRYLFQAKSCCERRPHSFLDSQLLHNRSILFGHDYNISRLLVSKVIWINMLLMWSTLYL